MKNTYSEIENSVMEGLDNLWHEAISIDEVKGFLDEILEIVAQATIDAVIPKEAIYAQNEERSTIMAVKDGWNLCHDKAIKNAEEFMGTKK